MEWSSNQAVSRRSERSRAFVGDERSEPECAPIRPEAQYGGHRLSVRRQEDIGEQRRAVAQRHGNVAPLLDAVGAAPQVVPGAVLAPQFDAECVDECAHGRVVAEGLWREVEVDPPGELARGVAVRVRDGDPGDEIGIGAEAL